MIDDVIGIHPSSASGQLSVATSMPIAVRAYHRVLKLAPLPAIADLAGPEAIQPAQLAEAIQYRPRRQGQAA